MREASEFFYLNEKNIGIILEIILEIISNTKSVINLPSIVNK
jgi:hypothetical protein